MSDIARRRVLSLTEHAGKDLKLWFRAVAVCREIGIPAGDWRVRMLYEFIGEMEQKTAAPKARDWTKVSLHGIYDLAYFRRTETLNCGAAGWTL